MCDVRILVLTGPGLDHEKDNSRQEKRDPMEFHNSAGGFRICRRHCLVVIQVKSLAYEKTGRLTEEAARVGLKLNTRKCKTLRTEYASNRERIAVNGEEMEDVGEFPYLGATVDKEGGGSRDIKNRLQKARGAFQRLRKVWEARGIGRGTKMRLFKTLVRPVLLYGCETWKITKADERRLNSFQCQCLRRILRIRWQQRISNNRVVEMADINNISCEITRRRWNWLGHVLRREDENNCFTALE